MAHVAKTTLVTIVLFLVGCGDADNRGAVPVTDPADQTAHTWSMDRPTSDWFTTLCGVLTGLEPTYDGSSEDVVSALTNTGDTLITTSAQLGAKPVPTFDGGSAYASDTVTDLAELGRSFHLAAEQWDSGRQDQARQTVDQAVAERTPTLDVVDPNISQELGNLPACQSVRSTF